MIFNTESVVGYNNNLRRATDDMKLGVNNHVNLGGKGPSLKPMAGRPSKINPPNSHPSNPIHKNAPVTDTSATDSDDTHHINKALVGLGALALVGFVFWARK